MVYNCMECEIGDCKKCIHENKSVKYCDCAINNHYKLKTIKEEMKE